MAETSEPSCCPAGSAGYLAADYATAGAFASFGEGECASSHRLRRPVGWYAARRREALALDPAAATLAGGLPAPLVVQYKQAVSPGRVV